MGHPFRQRPIRYADVTRSAQIRVRAAMVLMIAFVALARASDSR